MFRARLQYPDSHEPVDDCLAVCFGAVGYFGWRLAVPEPMLFWPFFFGFFAYHFWIQREWKRIDAKAGDLSEMPVRQDEAVARA